jgi:oxidase EvaA
MEVDSDVEQHDDFIWLTLGEIFELLRKPNMVNMDARTVLSCLPMAAPLSPSGQAGFRAALRRSITAEGAALMPLTEGRSWLTARKSGYTLTTRQIPLNSVPGWERDADEIRHRDGRYFTVLGVDVHATNREVASWRQPLLAPRGLGLVAFVVRRVDGVLHVLARADLRPGYRDTVELGPTVQCTPDNFADAPPERRPRYLDLVMSGTGRVRYDVLQSEEGGRFFHAVTRHMVVEVDDELPLATPADFAWLTLAQLRSMVAASYQVNIEARSLQLCLHAMSLERVAP